MNAKPISITVAFGGAVGVYLLALYLIFGPWLSAARQADARYDQAWYETQKYVTATVSSVPEITRSGGITAVKVVATYPDYYGQTHRTDLTLTGDNVRLKIGLTVYKDGRFEMATSTGPASRWHMGPILVGMLVGAFGLAILIGVGGVITRAWREYRIGVDFQEKRDREKLEATARKLAREAELTPLQRDAEARIAEAMALCDTVTDKQDLVNRARAVAEALSKPDTAQANQLRAELDVLERTIKQS